MMKLGTTPVLRLVPSSIIQMDDQVEYHSYW